MYNAREYLKVLSDDLGERITQPARHRQIIARLIDAVNAEAELNSPQQSFVDELIQAAAKENNPITASLPIATYINTCRIGKLPGR